MVRPAGSGLPLVLAYAAKGCQAIGFDIDPPKIDALLNGESQDDFRAAAKALDRVLTTGRYVIPIWYSLVSRLAHKKELKYPEGKTQMYGD